MVEGSVHMAATSLNLQKVAICKHVQHKRSVHEKETGFKKIYFTILRF